MTPGEQMTLIGAVQVLGFIVVAVAVIAGLMALATRAGLMDDPPACPWESDEGAS